ncbi:MAG: type II secretion system protein GspD [Opitutales bacterium]
MKKRNLTTLLILFLPMALIAQQESDSTDSTDSTDDQDIVVIEEELQDSETETEDGEEGQEDGESSAGADPEIVEIEEEPIEGARMDSEGREETEGAKQDEDDEIPDAEEEGADLDDETEVVLEMPGEEDGEGSAATLPGKETITVDYPDENVRTILRNVAELFDLNLVIPDGLEGRTSLKLKNVTWRDVFEVVLEPLGYTFIEDRNIIRVKSEEDIQAEPVDTRVFVINYANAESLKPSIEPLVDGSKGGRIEVDDRSNALVVTERPSKMNSIQEIIEKLDNATDQVMIETRFVEVRKTDAENLGLDWSGSLGEDAGVGIGVGEFLSKVEESDDVDFSLPDTQDAIGFNATAAGELSRNPMDTAVFSAEGFSTVLRALETLNDVELVSNPTVVTMNNEKAEIKITEEFPQPEFTFNAETGQRQFDGLGEPIDVGITLEVTPTVNAAGFINLDIFPEVSSTTRDRTIEGTEFPIREVRTAKTRIMIKDGFTLALGGLVASSMTMDESKVPLLGDIPGVGRLFRNQSEEMDETNLIIFITARTLNPDGTTYRDIVDPRQLNTMGITPDEVPGFDIPEEDQKTYREVEDLRHKAQRNKQIDRLQREIRELRGEEEDEGNVIIPSETSDQDDEVSE